MKQKECPQWQLFVDESGRFDELDTRVVCGLLINAPVNPRADDLLVRAFKEVFVGVAYPPHAYQHNWAAGRLVSLLQSGARPAPVSEAIVAGAMGCLEQHDHLTAVQAFRAAVEGEKYPEVEHVKVVDALLEQYATTEHECLKALRDRDRHSMWQLMRQIPALYRTDNVFVVGAAQPIGLKDEHDHGQDPYLWLLQLLLERVISLLRQRDSASAQRVWVTIARRNVNASLIPGGPPQTVQLLLRHVSDAIALASATPPWPVSSSADSRRALEKDSVRLQPRCIPPRYDTNVPAGLVLADFAANRLRWVMERSLTKSWKKIERGAASYFALPIAAKPQWAFGIDEIGSLAAIAVPGAPRARIQAAFADCANDDKQHACEASWIEEATMRWEKAARALRKVGG
jgi:hypothetical protein